LRTANSVRFFFIFDGFHSLENVIFNRNKKRIIIFVEYADADAKLSFCPAPFNNATTSSFLLLFCFLYFLK
jgi:hypothetical protein